MGRKNAPLVAMSLERVITEEREALTAEFLFPAGISRIQIPPYCAVPEFQVLRITPSELRSRYPIFVEDLQPGTPGRAFVQICPGLRYRFLWTHVDNDAYRDDYVFFLRKHHNMHISDLPSSYQVDHLYNRARAREMRLPFVRTVLLPKSVNMSHGAGYEKSRTRSGVGVPGRQRKIDEIVLMKLWGI